MVNASPGLLRFRELLMLAIGERTQAVFAGASGLSREHVSRLLNSEEMGTPSKQTLLRIANASEGRVTYEQLEAACREKKEEKKAKRKTTGDRLWDEASRYREFNQEIRDVISGFVDEIKNRAGKATRYISLEDLLNSVAKSLSLPNPEFVIQNRPVTKASEHMDAEKEAHVIARWKNDDYAMNVALELFYCETSGGGVIMSDAAFDLQTLVDCDHKMGIQALINLSEKENADTSKVPVVCSYSISEEYRKLEKSYQIERQGMQRLLQEVEKIKND